MHSGTCTSSASPIESLRMLERTKVIEMKQAFRQIALQPGLSIVVVAMLALDIGGTTVTGAPGVADRANGSAAARVSLVGLISQRRRAASSEIRPRRPFLRAAHQIG